MVGAERESAVTAGADNLETGVGGRARTSRVTLWTGVLLVAGALLCACASTQSSEHLAGDTAPDFGSLFPSWVPGPEWRVEGQPATYGPTNLFEYINGQAELYLSYGFQQVVTGTFTLLADGLTESVVAEAAAQGDTDACGGGVAPSTPTPTETATPTVTPTPTATPLPAGFFCLPVIIKTD